VNKNRHRNTSTICSLYRWNLKKIKNQTDYRIMVLEFGKKARENKGRLDVIHAN
jgi:hypothetical protein